MRNICNKAYNLAENYCWLLVQLFCTFLMRISCFCRGVTIGRKSKFIGLTKIKRGNRNDIVIGKKCTFRSITTSNLIGINRPCIITSTGPKSSSLTIGNNCGFSGTVVGCFIKIKIGNNVRCGANTLITDSDWHLDDSRLGDAQAITIKDNVFLGVNVTVLKGATIGKNSVIGAGSVVVSDIPPHVTAAGNPCRVVKSLVHSK